MNIQRKARVMSEEIHWLWFVQEQNLDECFPEGKSLNDWQHSVYKTKMGRVE